MNKAGLIGILGGVIVIIAIGLNFLGNQEGAPEPGSSAVTTQDAPASKADNGVAPQNTVPQGTSTEGTTPAPVLTTDTGTAATSTEKTAAEIAAEEAAEMARQQAQIAAEEALAGQQSETSALPAPTPPTPVTQDQSESLTDAKPSDIEEVVKEAVTIIQKDGASAAQEVVEQATRKTTTAAETAQPVQPVAPAPSIVEQSPAASQPEETASAASQIAAVPETLQAPEQPAAAVEPPPVLKTVPDPIIPAFDVVRLSRQGDSVFAGRGAPNTKVAIIADGKEIGSVETDARGEWVFLPTEPLPPGSYELSLKSVDETGVERESSSVVVVVVPEAAQNVASDNAEQDSGPVALLVPKEPEVGETKILQKPASVPGSVAAPVGELALDLVDYDETGTVFLSGTGTPGALVRTYLDNKFMGEGTVNSDGGWRVEPSDKVAPGVYTLRLDALVDEKVAARLELPFSRAEPVVAETGSTLVVVQPGNSLWRIARRKLGSGMAFTEIYQANRSQIRDPDLIYPGQIFQIPDSSTN